MLKILCQSNRIYSKGLLRIINYSEIGYKFFKSNFTDSEISFNRTIFGFSLILFFINIFMFFIEKI